MSNQKGIAISAIVLAAGIGAVLAVTSTGIARGSGVVPTTTAPVARTAQERASDAALAKVPGGTIKDTETECEDGRTVYSFEIATATGVVKVSVDAETGVASMKADDDDDEKGGKAEGEKKSGHADLDDDDDEHEDDDDKGCSAPKTVQK